MTFCGISAGDVGRIDDLLWSVWTQLQASTELHISEKMRKQYRVCVYVCKKKVLIGSVPHSVSHWPFLWSAAVMTRLLEIQRGKSSLNWFTWVQGIRFLLREGQKEMLPKKRPNQLESGKRIRERQRKTKCERGSQSSGMLWPWLTTKLRSNPISAKYWCCSSLAPQWCHVS